MEWSFVDSPRAPKLSGSGLRYGSDEEGVHLVFRVTGENAVEVTLSYFGEIAEKINQFETDYPEQVPILWETIAEGLRSTSEVVSSYAVMHQAYPAVVMPLGRSLALFIVEMQEIEADIARQGRPRLHVVSHRTVSNPVGSELYSKAEEERMVIGCHGRPAKPFDIEIGLTGECARHAQTLLSDGLDKFERFEVLSAGALGVTAETYGTFIASGEITPELLVQPSSHLLHILHTTSQLSRVVTGFASELRIIRSGAKFAFPRTGTG